MKTKTFLALIMVSSSAMALDFDTEWAKFSDDFSRLRGMKMAMVSPPPSAPASPVITPLPELNSGVNKIELVDPKSPVRLGRNLENPAMRDKMEKLYSKPDTVVYSLTLE